MHALNEIGDMEKIVCAQVVKNYCNSPGGRVNKDKCGVETTNSSIS